MKLLICSFISLLSFSILPLYSVGQAEKSTHDDVDLLFEIGMLSSLPRTGNPFLGSGPQSLADHAYRATAIAYVLSQRTEQTHDPYKLICMSLFHDVGETRSGNMNLLQQMYVSIDEKKIWHDIEKLSPLAKKMYELYKEFIEGKTPESTLAKDACTLELLLFLKEQHDLGNPRAKEWFENARHWIRTDEGKKFADEIEKTKADEWWKRRFEDKR